MMGFLHLEMCAQEAGGKLLGGSGWERMFVLSKIHKTGVAVSLLGGHKVKKTRQAYLVTLAWLEVLRFQGYENYCQGPGPHQSMDCGIIYFLHPPQLTTGVKLFVNFY